MYVSPWMQAALLPDRWRVAGIPCRALTVWHSFILSATGNPFRFSMHGSYNMNAAQELLVYCSRNHAEGKRLYVDEGYRKAANVIMHDHLSHQKWDDVMDACADYVTCCTRVPGHKQAVPDPKAKATPSRPAAAPFAYILVEYLSRLPVKRSWFRATDPIEAAWDTPYATACCLFDAGRDIRGEDSSLETMEEAERFDRYLEKQKAGAA